MSYIGAHAGSNSPIYFGSAAASDVPGTRMEPKYCEGCGRMYMRPVHFRYLQRDCERCVKAAEKRRSREARELVAALELGAPKKMMTAQ